MITNKKPEYIGIGTRPVRHDGVDKVIGKAQYGADINFPGMLYAKVLRSPYAHAKIKSIDTSKAEKHPDVKAIVTARDLSPLPDKNAEIGEDLYANMKYVRDRILASDKVLFKGHPIAAIAAKNFHDAEELLSLIKVEYEVLPAVSDVESAMKPDSIILHKNIKAESLSGETFKGSNIASHDQYSNGDVEAGFNQADIVIEREFRTKTVHQGYIEPQNATAIWRSDDHVTIWCSSQGAFQIRDQVSVVLGMEISQITIVPLEIGGGFGGKINAYLEPITALLSKKTGKPVKSYMTRSEVIESTGPTSGSYVKAKIGATKDGKITAAKAFLAFEAGAFPGSPIGGATACMLSPYNIENLLLDGYDVVNNKPKTSAYRAPGAPIGALAVETIIDEIAKELNIDPVDFRLLNAAKEGTRRANGIVNPKIGMVETAEILKNHISYTTPLNKNGKLKGRGVAFGYWTNNTGPSSCTATVTPAGSINLNLGSVDVGGSRTAIALQLAEVLELPVTDINPRVVDTDSVGYTSLTAGSGTTFKTGWAAYEAGLSIKSQVIKRAATLWNTSENNLEYSKGRIINKFDEELHTTFKEIALSSNTTGGPIISSVGVNPTGAGASIAAMVVDVEVDPETGKTTILKCTAFTDVGTAIHRDYVEGQIQGGSVQGIGWALNEEYFMGEDGQVLNSSLLDYRMPTSLDLPMIEAVVVEIPNPGHPFGIRGVGESPLIPPLAAVANAIHDAIGVRMMELPMTPATVRKALQTN